MTELIEHNNRIYLILDGSKTTNKEYFLKELGALLKFQHYKATNWEELKQDLDISVAWTNEQQRYAYICLYSNTRNNIVDITTKINVIWIHPLNFSKYNSADFLAALDILKEINDDENNPLTFLLAGDVSCINTELYK